MSAFACTIIALELTFLPWSFLLFSVEATEGTSADLDHPGSRCCAQGAQGMPRSKCRINIISFTQHTSDLRLRYGVCIPAWGTSAVPRPASFLVVLAWACWLPVPIMLPCAETSQTPFWRAPSEPLASLSPLAHLFPDSMYMRLTKGSCWTAGSDSVGLG